MNGFVAPLLGWLLGSLLLATGIALALVGQWGAAMVLGHGGGMLWLWAQWRQRLRPE